MVAGSTAIIEYLDARHFQPRLVPGEPAQAAEARLWASWADRLLGVDTRRVLTPHWWRHPADAERYFFAAAPRHERAGFRLVRRPFALVAILYRGAFPAAVRSAQKRVDTAFELLEAALAERDHLVGDSLTLADISVAVAANMMLIPPAGRERYAGTRALEWVDCVLPAPYKRWL